MIRVQQKRDYSDQLFLREIQIGHSLLVKQLRVKKQHTWNISELFGKDTESKGGEGTKSVNGVSKGGYPEFLQADRCATALTPLLQIPKHVLNYA